MERSKLHLDWLDYARFVAALSVVFFYYLANGPRNGKLSTFSGFPGLTSAAEYGYLGVDLFFMISGFVIMFSAHNSTAQRFLVSRVIRLWPAFAVCMTITALVRALWGGPGMEVSVLQYLANLTMLPKKFGHANMDGVYWTLALEIYFYAIVLTVIALGQISRSQTLVEGWIAIIFVCWLADIKPLVIGHHSIFFASGCALSFLYRDGVNRRNAITLAVCIALAVATAVGRSEGIAIRRSADLHTLVIAVVVLSFFAIFLLFNGK